MTTYLALSWSVSRGMNTYGYNICRLDDQSTGKRYRCNGGGYDMVGTVFGNWLQDRYQDRLLDMKRHAYAWRSRREESQDAPAEGDLYYGMTYDEADDRVLLDGACGIESMQRIAEAIGLRLERTYKVTGRNRGETTGWIVTDTRLTTSV